MRAFARFAAVVVVMFVALGAFAVPAHAAEAVAPCPPAVGDLPFRHITPPIESQSSGLWALSCHYQATGTDYTIADIWAMYLTPKANATGPLAEVGCGGVPPGLLQMGEIRRTSRTKYVAVVAHADEAHTSAAIAAADALGASISAIAKSCPGAAPPVAELKVGLACDTKDLDASGDVVCRAAVEGAAPGAQIRYDWEVDGEASPQHGSELKTYVYSSQTHKVTVKAVDTTNQKESPTETASFVRQAAGSAPIATPSDDGSKSNPTAGLLVLAGAAVAIALAVAALRHRRKKAPPPPAAAATPPPPPEPTRPPDEPRLVVRVNLPTSALTEGRHSDGVARILGDDADVAFATCEVDVEPRNWQVLSHGKPEWVASAVGHLATGTDVVSKALHTPVDPETAAVRAYWSDIHTELTLTATVTAEVVGGPAGAPRTLSGQGTATLGVVGAYPYAQLEASPSGPLDRDGTTIVTISPSLWVFDQLFPGDVTINSIDRAATTDNFERLDTLPATAERLRCVFSFIDPALPPRLVAVVQPSALGHGAEVRQTGVDVIVDRHIASCAAHVGEIAAEPLELTLRPCRAEVQFPKSHFLPTRDFEPRLPIKVKVTTASGGAIKDNALTKDIPPRERDAWSFRFTITPPRRQRCSACRPYKSARPVEAPPVNAGTRGELRAGFLLFGGSDRPEGFADDEYVYDHDDVFGGSSGKYEPCRGDQAKVTVEFAPGKERFKANEDIEIGVEEWADVVAYAVSRYEGYIDEKTKPWSHIVGEGGRQRVLERTEPDLDLRIRWYIRNAIQEDAYRLRDRMRHEWEFHPDGVERPDVCQRVDCTTLSDYVCHDFAWRPEAQRSDPAGPTGHLTLNADTYPQAHGYHELNINDDAVGLAQLRPGDIVCYFQSSGALADHSAVVVSVKGDRVMCRSKDTRNAEFIHELGHNDDEKNFFRFKYGAAGLRFFRPN